MAKEAVKRDMFCKRCGAPGHMSKTCKIPRLTMPRPDLERMTSSLDSSPRKTVSADKLRDVIEYARQVECSRRNAVLLIQSYLTRGDAGDVVTKMQARLCNIRDELYYLGGDEEGCGNDIIRGIADQVQAVIELGGGGR